MPYAYTDVIRRSYRGDMAHRHVTAISQHHRIQASPGYRAAAEYVVAQLVRPRGCKWRSAATRPMGAPVSGRRPAFWSGHATTHGWPAGRRRASRSRLLCDFAAVPISLIQRSIPVDGEFDVVALAGKGGKEPRITMAWMLRARWC